MGTVSQELVRRFNETNNEEAGEHWTPRGVVKLMSNLIFRPVADQLTSGTYLLYDSALGTGGMLTVAEPAPFWGEFTSPVSHGNGRPSFLVCFM